MKKLLILLFLLITTPAWAATYYVKNGGNDSADGLSDANAWATIAKVEATTFTAGDIISLKCGNTWAETLTISWSGSTSNYITFNSYGTGAKPQISKINVYAPPVKSYIIIDGLSVLADLGCITLEACNNIIIKNCLIDGNGKNSPCVSTTGQGTTYAYNIQILSNTIKNGGVVGSGTNGIGIQCGWGSRDILVQGNTVINCEEVGLQTFGSIGGAYPPYNITFRENEVYFTPAVTRNGTGGINIGWEAYNVLVDKNYVHDLKNAYAIDSATEIGNNRIINNVAYNCLELLTVMANAYGECNNSTVAHNNFIAGPNTVNSCWYISNSGSTGTNHIFKNNIITSLESWWPNLIIEDGITVDSDYNCFYNVELAGNAYFSTDYTVTDYFTLAGWQSATGQDAHSIAADPLLTDTYKIGLTSPCLNAGVDVGVGTDYDGNLRYRGSAPDIGAYEYQYTRYPGHRKNKIFSIP